jgi:hypothetical protein
MEIHGNSPNSLNSIGMNGNAMRNRGAGKVLYRLDCASLVVREHERGQPRSLVESCCHEFDACNTLVVYGWAVDLEALGLKARYRLSDSGVLNWTRD